MKIAARVGIIMLSLVLATSAFAAGPADKNSNPMSKYQDMLENSNELREADKAIKDTLADAKKYLPDADFKQIESQQSKWVKNEFNINVKAYMKEGMSEPEAWAMEIGSHADNIARSVEIFRLRREGVGNEGVYEFSRGQGDTRMHGIMLVKKVDNSYTVNIELTSGRAGAINVSDAAVCTFVGEGNIKDKVLTAVTEDAPESSLNVVFMGNMANVTASPGADEQCGKGMTLSNKYTK